MWLCDCGLIHKIERVTSPKIPIKAYENQKAFKLFTADIGLLGCMTGINQSIILNGSDMFTEFKGALTEQYVCQQLKTVEDLNIYYYTNDRGSCEINFIADTGEEVIPIKVKAQTNLKSKRLKTYREKFSPRIAVRTSMSDFKTDGSLINIPLYEIENIKQFLK